LEDVLEQLSNLKLENQQLKVSNSYNETALTNLHEQLDEDTNKYRSLHVELSENVKIINQLRLQAEEAKLKQERAERQAEERARELDILERRWSAQNTELENELQLSKTSQNHLETNYFERVEMLESEMDRLKAMYESKCLELDCIKAEHQRLLDEDVLNSEELQECKKELQMCKKAGRELDVKYRESLEQLQIDQRKLEDLQQMIENEDVKTADEKNTNKKKIRLLEEKLILLQSQLDDSIEKLRETQVTLDFGEEEKRKLLHKLS
jgi:multidrug efflux pump subunit AcrA (membrane-fusion protein)